MYNPTTL